jgi:D-alanyl-D-alanine carboxypeptidase
MKTKSLQRAFLLASGLCAVLVILLSQSFYKVADSTSDKKEKSKDKTEVAIHAPSDVAAQGQSVELNPTQPVVQEKTVLADQKNEKAIFIQRIATRFFKTLFRAIISPNAP